ncbi:DUF4956 domain-containing protein [Pseudoalteromonas sp.]|uniref:DUF4956 domain-containing protein n=1 Tax=Pseudoalteromonas sp. TaxID=53249 RepID=UPI00356B18E1
MESVDPMLIAFLPKDIRNMFFPYASVQLASLVFNLIIGFVMASIIGAHFRKYASAFCNRQDFSRLFPLLMLSVILIITVVKASLALALGLVGALSIVRFRTPIKEPEELLYLFLNIGIAVALGAGQTLAAVVSCFVTLLLIAWIKKRDSQTKQENGLFLSLNHVSDTGYQDTQLVSQLKELLSSHADRIELRRIDIADTRFDASFFISVSDEKQIDACMNALSNAFNGINISLLEQHNIAGV